MHEEPSTPAKRLTRIGELSMAVVPVTMLSVRVWMAEWLVHALACILNAAPPVYVCK